MEAANVSLHGKHHPGTVFYPVFALFFILFPLGTFLIFFQLSLSLMVGILPFPPEATNHLILSLFDTISLRRSSKKTRSSNSSSLNSFSLLVVSTSDELRADAATKCDLKDLPWTLAQLHYCQSSLSCQYHIYVVRFQVRRTTGWARWFRYDAWTWGGSWQYPSNTKF